MLYFAVNVSLTWVLVGTFYLIYSVLVQTVFSPYTSEGDVYDIASWLNLIHFSLIFMILLLSLGVKPDMVKN